MTSSSERLRPSTERTRGLIYRRSSSSSQLQQQQPLIAFIKKSDNLPKEWMPSKQKRRSDGDIQALEQQWERVHGINQQSQTKRRSSWTSSVLFKSFPPRFLRWETLPLSPNVSARLDFLAHKSYGNRTRSSFWARVAGKWRVTFALCRRQSKDLKIKLKTHYNALPGLRLFENRESILSALKAMSTSVFAMVWDITSDIWSILRIMLRFSWFLLKWPALFLLAGLLCLQILALIYTICSTAFLNSFCQRKLPFVRDQVCGSWDALRKNLEMRDATNLNHPFQTILQSNEDTMSYELPFHIARYQTTIRTFRASLPESEYTASDQTYFRDRFTDFIDQSSHIVVTAQRFHAHILGTINTHVSDTKYVVQRIQDEFPSKPIRTPNLLATSMAWLESCYLIYLPNGIEPFEETSLAVYNARNVQLMEQHVALIADRLLTDIDLTLTLQSSLWSLGQISEEIATHVSQYKSTNAFDANERDKTPLLRVREFFGGQAHESYQIDQRRKWLNVMGPEFQNAATFLNLAALQLNTAHFSCQELLERLSIEGRAVKYGFEQSEWVRLQVAELDAGMKDLEAQLKAFKLEQLRFDERAFRRESSNNDIPTIEQSTVRV